MSHIILMSTYFVTLTFKFFMNAYSLDRLLIDYRGQDRRNNNSALLNIYYVSHCSKCI